MFRVTQREREIPFVCVEEERDFVCVEEERERERVLLCSGGTGTVHCTLTGSAPKIGETLEMIPGGFSC